MFGGDVEGGFGSSSEEDELENLENSENLENLETDKKDYSHDIDIDLDHQFDNQAKPSTKKIANNEPTKNISKNRDDYKLKTSNNSTNRESIQDRNNSKLNKKLHTDNKESIKNSSTDRDVSESRRTTDSTNRESNKTSFRGTNDSRLKRTSQSENNDYFRELDNSKLTKTLHQTNIGGSNKIIFSEKDKIRKEKVPLIQIRISKPALSEEKKRKRIESGKIS